MKELSASDLGALLCSKVCHDVISPVGAITNGLELIEEDIDGSMRDMANDLIKRSATQASAKLAFARIAYGAAGSAGAEIDTGDAEKVAQDYMVAEKADLEWEVARQLLPKNQVKLILNLLLLSLNCVPLGGKITVSMTGDASAPFFTLRCVGPKPRLADTIVQMTKGIPDDGTVDAHSVQPYYAGLLARLSGLSIAMQASEEAVIITAS